jgi:hypothetical protein
LPLSDCSSKPSPESVASEIAGAGVPSSRIGMAEGREAQISRYYQTATKLQYEQHVIKLLDNPVRIFYIGIVKPK